MLTTQHKYINSSQLKEKFHKHVQNIERSSDMHFTQITQAYALSNLGDYKEHIRHTKKMFNQLALIM